MSVTWLITGSSRGLGFELVKQLIASPDNFVIATCRNPSRATALQSLKDGAKGTLHVAPLDVSDQASVHESVKVVKNILGDRGLDYLYNNAGITPGPDEAFNFNYADLLKTFETNVAAPGLVAQVYLPLVEKSTRKVIVNVSSGLGSIGNDRGSIQASYCVSKAALNMLTYKQAKARPDIIAIAFAPGWVKTDMGGSNAILEPHQSASATIKVVTGLTPKDSGRFFNYTGDEFPW